MQTIERRNSRLQPIRWPMRSAPAHSITLAPRVSTRISLESLDADEGTDAAGPGVPVNDPALDQCLCEDIARRGAKLVNVRNCWPEVVFSCLGWTRIRYGWKRAMN